MGNLDALLDEAAAAADRQEWLETRAEGFGCSDLGALWLILGWAGEDVFDWHEVAAEDGTTKWVSNLYVSAPNGERDYVTPRYLMESWQTMKRCGLPRLIAEKAGRAKPRAQSDAQAEGSHKERLLFQHSRLGRFETQAFYAPDVEVATLPPEWKERIVSTKPLVLRDAVEPRLLCTVEAWEYTERGAIAWELKTDRLGLRRRAPWAQRLQAIGQATVLGTDAFGLIYGPRWALTDEPHFADLPEPVQFGPYIVKDDDRAMIRRAAKLGWELVEAARAQQKG